MRKQEGFSLIELLIVVAIILIIAAIAIPNIVKSRQSANEAAAASTLRTLHTSEYTYELTYNQGYANTLAKLGPGSPCDDTHGCLIDATLGCASEPCVKGGYKYFMTSSSSSAPYQDYASSTTPVAWGTTGAKNFCASEDGIVRYEVTATAALGAAVPHGTCVNFSTYNGI